MSAQACVLAGGYAKLIVAQRLCACSLEASSHGDVLCLRLKFNTSGLTVSPDARKSLDKLEALRFSLPLRLMSERPTAPLPSSPVAETPPPAGQAEHSASGLDATTAVTELQVMSGDTELQSLSAGKEPFPEAPARTLAATELTGRPLTPVLALHEEASVQHVPRRSRSPPPLRAPGEEAAPRSAAAERAPGGSPVPGRAPEASARGSTRDAGKGEGPESARGSAQHPSSRCSSARGDRAAMCSAELPGRAAELDACGEGGVRAAAAVVKPEPQQGRLGPVVDGTIAKRAKRIRRQSEHWSPGGINRHVSLATSGAAVKKKGQGSGGVKIACAKEGAAAAGSGSAAAASPGTAAVPRRDPVKPGHTSAPGSGGDSRAAHPEAPRASVACPGSAGGKDVAAAAGCGKPTDAGGGPRRGALEATKAGYAVNVASPGLVQVRAVCGGRADVNQEPRGARLPVHSPVAGLGAPEHNGTGAPEPPRPPCPRDVMRGVPGAAAVMTLQRAARELEACVERPSKAAAAPGAGGVRRADGVGSRVGESGTVGQLRALSRSVASFAAGLNAEQTQSATAQLEDGRGKVAPGVLDSSVAGEVPTAPSQQVSIGAATLAQSGGVVNPVGLPPAGHKPSKESGGMVEIDLHRSACTTRAGDGARNFQKLSGQSGIECRGENPAGDGEVHGEHRPAVRPDSAPSGSVPAVAQPEPTAPTAQQGSVGGKTGPPNLPRSDVAVPPPQEAIPGARAAVPVRPPRPAVQAPECADTAKAAVSTEEGVAPRPAPLPPAKRTMCSHAAPPRSFRRCVITPAKAPTRAPSTKLAATPRACGSRATAPCPAAPASLADSGAPHVPRTACQELVPAASELAAPRATIPAPAAAGRSSGPAAAAALAQRSSQPPARGCTAAAGQKASQPGVAAAGVAKKKAPQGTRPQEQGLPKGWALQMAAAIARVPIKLAREQPVAGPCATADATPCAVARRQDEPSLMRDAQTACTTDSPTASIPHDRSEAAAAPANPATMAPAESTGPGVGRPHAGGGAQGTAMQGPQPPGSSRTVAASRTSMAPVPVRPTGDVVTTPAVGQGIGSVTNWMRVAAATGMAVLGGKSGVGRAEVAHGVGEAAPGSAPDDAASVGAGGRLRPRKSAPHRCVPTPFAADSRTSAGLGIGSPGL